MPGQHIRNALQFCPPRSHRRRLARTHLWEEVSMLRKPLLLALLAAGIIANDGFPEAQSTIFVPELAMLDGTLCVPNAAMAPMPPMLVAQAARTEVSPTAAKAAASGAPGTAGAGQPIIPGIGTRSFKIINGSKVAQ